METINISNAKSENEHKMFKGDGLRLVFLTLLYSIQGFGFGFLDMTMPVILKKHFTYSEIGIISWCCFPFSIKILFAPFVDTYYIKWLGKKRSWIIPTQLLLVIFNFYMSISINQLIEDKRYIVIAVMFFIMILLCAFQDIAIDGWCLTMVHESNRDYASLTQVIGIEIGVFLSTTVYYALNSIDFCNSYLYSSTHKEPLLNESNFFLLWSLFVFIVLIITFVFSNENKDRIKVEEHGLSFDEVIYTIKCSLKSNQIIFYVMFSLCIRLFSKINAYVGRVYLLDEIKYSQSTYSFISLLGFPVTMISSILIIKLGKNFKILQKIVLICTFRAICDILTINCLYSTYTPGLYFDIMLFISNCSNIFTSVSWYTIHTNYSNTVANPIIASTQVTFIHSLKNFGDEFPKIYTFWLVGKFGIFTPNLIGCILTLIICALFYSKTADPSLYKVMEITEAKQKDS